MGNNSRLDFFSFTDVVLLQWFEEKLQEVESADQHFRKLHALVESLVVHRKGQLSPSTCVKL